jgi:hypothetical protein
MTKKQLPLSKDKIISAYMNYVLTHDEKPKSVYSFSKFNGFEESEFYAFFGNLEAVESSIIDNVFEKTLLLLQKDTAYEGYDSQAKLLSFYFTFFEILTLNRSYFLQLFQADKKSKSVKIYSKMRTEFKQYLDANIVFENQVTNEKIQNIKEKVTSETFWAQFFSILQFWMADSSAAFEKTDIYIEKATKASFELMHIKPLESIIDFGKFIFKEKMQQFQ